MKLISKILLGILLFYILYHLVNFSESVFYKISPPTIKYYDENLNIHTGKFNMNDPICSGLWDLGLNEVTYIPLKFIRQCLLNEGV